MMKGNFVKVMLVIIAALLLLNLFGAKVSTFMTKEADAAKAQSLPFRGNGVGIECSSDGRYVFAVASSGIYRSANYGEPGSWETVVE